MGMFDHVCCLAPLPFDWKDIPVQPVDFQTKSLTRLLDTYYITEDGYLEIENKNRIFDLDGSSTVRAKVNFDGIINFYTNLQTEKENVECRM